MRFFPPANIAQLADFDEIVDVRTPAEFAEDHVPGAINCPVLSDEERVTVGTLYKQVSPFEARRVGAALVARNIAGHLETGLADRPKGWRPLVYCWRGGQRSGSMTLILQQIGWGARQLEGGYKQYRHLVLEELQTLPGRFDYRVVCGPTGSGKTRLLTALRTQGRQVLDLEALANHRGSVLGRVPGEGQPTQKGFDSALRAALLALDPQEPVFVEAESKRIGFVSLPDALVTSMRAARCIYVDVPFAERVRYLLEDYDFFVHSPAMLVQQLGYLRELYGRKKLAEWQAWTEAGDFYRLVEDLLANHYDPLYFRSMGKHFARLAEAQRLDVGSLDSQELERQARLL